jgi:hypothetical protein
MYKLLLVFIFFVMDMVVISGSGRHGVTLPWHGIIDVPHSPAVLYTTCVKFRKTKTRHYLQYILF